MVKTKAWFYGKEFCLVLKGEEGDMVCRREESRVMTERVVVGWSEG